MRYRYNRGVTLIELMITVSIVGILAAVVYPSYRGHLIKSRRATDGAAFLMQVAQAQERYLSLPANTAYAASMSNLGFADVSPEGYYDVVVDATDPSGYLLTASPTSKGAQDEDSCGTLTLTATLVKGADAGNCW